MAAVRWPEHLISPLIISSSFYLDLPFSSSCYLPFVFLIYTLHTKYDILETIKNGVTGLAVILGAMVLIPGLMAEKFWQGMFSWIASPWFDLFPIVGWTRGMMSYAFHQNLILALAFFGLYVLTYYLIVRLVIQFAGYYYEDVLEVTKSNEIQRDKVKGKKEASEATGSLNTKKTACTS